jgi:hypothetical protein
MDDKWWEKLIWAFGSVELKIGKFRIICLESGRDRKILQEVGIKSGFFLSLVMISFFYHFQQYFSYIMVVSLNGGWNHCTWRKTKTT